MSDRIFIAVGNRLVEKLSEEFFWEGGGFSDFNMDPDASYSLVARVSGLSVVIWSDEHPPPHFHVRYQGEDASFSILDCERLAGTKGLERYEWRIRGWWDDHRSELIQTWNKSRPTDCPVGPIEISD